MKIGDIGDGEDKFAETGEPFVVVMAGADHDEGGEIEAEGRGIEAKGVLAEEAAVLQGAEAFPAGIL
ncbi:hypothetical protein AA21952_1033 [Acetobacter oeni LMG 21952]|nr:hypothetical protein AA21952_1033 [Acetobacter oeni LMG 21952]